MTINLSIYICHVELQIVDVASASTIFNGFFSFRKYLQKLK